jgi:hypothetical protein
MSLDQWSKEAQFSPSQSNEGYFLKLFPRYIEISAFDRENIIARRQRLRNIEILDDYSLVANITLPLLPLGTAQVQFPPNSIPDAEDISIKPLGLLSVDKSFMYKRNQYLWETISGFTERDYTLYQCMRQRKKKITKFKQLAHGIEKKISHNTAKIDKMVVLSTLVVILKGK